MGSSNCTRPSLGSVGDDGSAGVCRSDLVSFAVVRSFPRSVVLDCSEASKLVASFAFCFCFSASHTNARGNFFPCYKARSSRGGLFYPKAQCREEGPVFFFQS